MPKELESGMDFLPPLGLMYLAGFIKEKTEHEVVLLDCELEKINYDNLAERIRQENPGVVGITAMTFTLLDVIETCELINFRIAKAGYRGSKKLFLDEAISEIYNMTKGYPRKINMLCHKTLKEMVIRNVPVADRELIRDIVANEKQFLSATKLIMTNN